MFYLNYTQKDMSHTTRKKNQYIIIKNFLNDTDLYSKGGRCFHILSTLFARYTLYCFIESVMCR